MHSQVSAALREAECDISIVQGRSKVVSRRKVVREVECQGLALQIPSSA